MKELSKFGASYCAGLTIEADPNLSPQSSRLTDRESRSIRAEVSLLKSQSANAVVNVIMGSEISYIYIDVYTTECYPMDLIARAIKPLDTKSLYTWAHQ
jgi:hypothetical protein